VSAQRYALLTLPSANRVYTAAAPRLAVAELEVLGATALRGRLGAIRTEVLGGAPYTVFEVDGGLDERGVAHVSDHSSAYALFAVEGGLLRPVGLRRRDRFDDDLLTVARYPGKTNEQFTKLLLNVTLLSATPAGGPPERPAAVLDPLCGRGTTLHQGLVYGLDVAGVDLDRRDIEAYGTVLRRWLQDKRLKHSFEAGPVRRHKKVVATRVAATVAATKEDARAGRVVHATAIGADTTAAPDFFRPASFDVVVTDLPYGVQHGSRSAARGLARGPAELLAAALPAWVALLRPGGAVGLAVNTHTAPRAETVAALALAGLEVLDGEGHEAYRGFRHRVDSSIDRDVVVARKP